MRQRKKSEKKRKTGGKRRRRRSQPRPAPKSESESASKGGTGGAPAGAEIEDQSNKLNICLGYFFRDHHASAGCQNRDEVHGASARDCKACVRAKWQSVLEQHCSLWGKTMLEGFCDQSAALHEKWRKDPSSKPSPGPAH